MVSVLMPARNAEATLELAVRSILSQSLRELELVAVDDGSTDGTGAMLGAWVGRDSRVRVLEGGGRGLVAALNLGRRHCRGRYLARMDADDESLPERLEQSVLALEADASLCGVGTQVELFRDDRPVSPNMAAYGRWLNSLTSPERLFQERFVESPLCHPSATLRREALEEVGGYCDGDSAEDYQLWLELLARGRRLSVVPQVLFRWRDQEKRLTRTDPRYSPAQMLKLKARYLARALPRSGDLTVWGAGQMALALARLLEAEGVTVGRFVEVSPRKIGQRIEGKPIIAPAALGPPRGGHLVAAVGAKGAREEIRAFLAREGWTEGRDFTCAA
ncbi:MAG: glycosyltransferase family 2 protein [Myxococcaceae bacterium]